MSQCVIDFYLFSTLIFVFCMLWAAIKSAALAHYFPCGISVSCSAINSDFSMAFSVLLVVHSFSRDGCCCCCVCVVCVCVCLLVR